MGLIKLCNESKAPHRVERAKRAEIGRGTFSRKHTRELLTHQEQGDIIGVEIKDETNTQEPIIEYVYIQQIVEVEIPTIVIQTEIVEVEKIVTEVQIVEVPVVIIQAELSKTLFYTSDADLAILIVSR